MNFTELMQTHTQRGNDRQAIADALGLTQQQIDQMQNEAMRIASTLTPESIVVAGPPGGTQNLKGTQPERPSGNL